MLAKLAASLIKVVGGTDSTTIGNVGDSLKVSVTSGSSLQEYEAPTFTVWSLATATANNKSMISLVNTTGSTVALKIRAIRMINTQNTAVTGVVVDINGYRCTSHSGGTLLTPAVMDTSDTLNSSLTVRTGATIVGEVTTPLIHLDLSTDEWGPGANDVEATDHTFQSLHFFYEHKYPMKPITLRANEGFTLKCVTNTTTGSYDIQVLFTQETT